MLVARGLPSSLPHLPRLVLICISDQIPAAIFYSELRSMDLNVVDRSLDLHQVTQRASLTWNLSATSAALQSRAVVAASLLAVCQLHGLCSVRGAVKLLQCCWSAARAVASCEEETPAGAEAEGWLGALWSNAKLPLQWQASTYPCSCQSADLQRRRFVVGGTRKLACIAVARLIGRQQAGPGGRRAED